MPACRATRGRHLLFPLRPTISRIARKAQQQPQQCRGTPFSGIHLAWQRLQPPPMPQHRLLQFLPLRGRGIRRTPQPWDDTLAGCMDWLVVAEQEAPTSPSQPQAFVARVPWSLTDAAMLQVPVHATALRITCYPRGASLAPADLLPSPQQRFLLQLQRAAAVAAAVATPGGAQGHAVWQVQESTEDVALVPATAAAAVGAAAGAGSPILHRTPDFALQLMEGAAPLELLHTAQRNVTEAAWQRVCAPRMARYVFPGTSVRLQAAEKLAASAASTLQLMAYTPTSALPHMDTASHGPWDLLRPAAPAATPRGGVDIALTPAFPDDWRRITAVQALLLPRQVPAATAVHAIMEPSCDRALRSLYLIIGVAPGNAATDAEAPMWYAHDELRPLKAMDTRGRAVLLPSQVLRAAPARPPAAMEDGFGAVVPICVEAVALDQALAREAAANAGHPRPGTAPEDDSGSHDESKGSNDLDLDPDLDSSTTMPGSGDKRRDEDPQTSSIQGMTITAHPSLLQDVDMVLWAPPASSPTQQHQPQVACLTRQRPSWRMLLPAYASPRVHFLLLPRGVWATATAHAAARGAQRQQHDLLQHLAASDAAGELCLQATESGNAAGSQPALAAHGAGTLLAGLRFTLSPTPGSSDHTTQPQVHVDWESPASPTRAATLATAREAARLLLGGLEDALIPARGSGCTHSRGMEPGPAPRAVAQPQVAQAQAQDQPLPPRTAPPSEEAELTLEEEWKTATAVAAARDRRRSRNAFLLAGVCALVLLALLAWMNYLYSRSASRCQAARRK